MRRSRVLAVAALVVAVLAGTAVLTVVLTDRPASERSLLYLSLGDSLAAGYQPAGEQDGDTQGSGGDGTGPAASTAPATAPAPTPEPAPSPGTDDRTDLDGGYAGTVLAGLAAATPEDLAAPDDAAEAASPVDTAQPELVNLGCSGETTQTFVDGGRCEYDEGSQLDAAIAVLDDADERPVVVTLALGANDLQQCLVPNPFAPTLDDDCARAGTQAVARTVPAVLDRLTQAAPQARVVVLDYYNPYLAGRLLGERGEALAEQSEVHAAALNSALAAAAADSRAVLAEVSDAFATADASPDPATGRPVNVERICTWTWMCRRLDVHPDDEGYEVIAGQVLAALDAGARTGAG